MQSRPRIEIELSASRFEVRRLLGWGGMGVVYEAFDRKHRSRIALKTLRSMDAAGLLRFKNEFRLLADLAHPNLVRLGELLEENGQIFFTMELVSGLPFVDYVRGLESPSEEPPKELPNQDNIDTAKHPDLKSSQVEAYMAKLAGAFDEGRLRSALAQLVHGLGALHRSGRVHRDIKPSNVLVTKEGRVVILDFGLVAETLADEEDSVVGTAHFMAPEQATGKPVGPAADFYSVGVMLYLAVTGVLPFDVSSDAALRMKQTATPVPPSAKVPGLAPDLDQLILHLLRIDPNKRAGENDILDVLGEGRAPISVASGAALGFVGRHRELEELDSAFEGALLGNTRAVFVEGESGVGKTTLGRKFLERAGRVALVLSARCYERESVPYKAVDGIVDRVGPYLSKLPPAEAIALLPEDISLAATVFPVLGIADSVAKQSGPPSARRPVYPLGDKGLVLDLLKQEARREPPSAGPAEAALSPDSGPAVEIEPAELRSRMFAAMRRLFASIASRRPVILAIDDLQWADADSLALLSEILRPEMDPERTARSPILLLATVRTGTDVSRSASISLSIPPEYVRTLHLTRMPPDEARDLVGALLRSLGTDPAQSGAIDMSAVLSEGRGHPLFLDALVRHRVTHEGATGPVRLDDALWARIEELPPRARTLLTVICVAGGPVSRRVAQHALSAEPEEIDRLIAALRAEHFARATGFASAEALEPYHDRIRETALARLSAEDRRGWHARLAVALETMGTGQSEELSIHWQGAGDTARAALYAARAGDEAAAALAFDRAARLYRTALSLSPSNAPERPSLTLRLADAQSNGGRGHEAAEAYLTAADLYPEGSSLELRRRAAENLLRSGYVEEGMQHMRAVLATVGLDIPNKPSGALTSLMIRRAELRLRGLSYTERHSDKIPAAELRRVDICWSAAKGLGMVDTMRGSYFQVRALLAALAAGDPYRVSRSLSFEAGFVATVGPSAHDRTEELLRAAQASADKSRHPHALAFVPGMAGVAAFLEGRFHDAVPLLTESEHQMRTRCVGVSWEIGSLMTFLLWSWWWLGDLRALCERASAIIREAEDRGDRYLATNLCSGYTNVIWLIGGAPDTAAARAAGAIGPWSRGNAHLQQFHDLVARVHIDLYRGDGAAAYKLITSEWKALEDSMNLRIQVVRVTCEYLRGAAALAALSRSSNRSEMIDAAVRAGKRIEGERVGWATPLGLMLRAAAKVAEGERGAGATSLLEEAIQGAKAHGMMAYCAAAQRALGLTRGASEGNAQRAAAEADLASRGVKNPALFARMLLPGFDV